MEASKTNFFGTQESDFNETFIQLKTHILNRIYSFSVCAYECVFRAQ